MKPSVYIETTVISYLTARPSRDLVVAGHQQTTYDWWTNRLPGFEAFLSPVVIDEISRGNAAMAQRRLDAVSELKLLELLPEVEKLADVYFAQLQLPMRARADALHLAFAAWHGMDFLVTWNCSHIASGFVRREIKKTNALWEIISPTICTPEELIEDIEEEHD